METVEIQSTSRQTAVCSDILLREGPTVRLIFRPQLVDNPHDPDACVKGRFVYQRKGKNDEWEDVDSPSLASLKRGEYFELEIKSGELLPLLRQLGALFRFHRKQGMPKGRVELVRIGQHLAKLLELSEPELDAFLSENTSDAMETLRRVLRWIANNPGTAEQLAANERQLPELNALVGLANLRAVLQIWSDNAENDDEESWQGVFATHSYVLSQLFAYPVAIIKGKAYVGGKRYDNLHGNLVDFLGHAPSSGSAILIEIKTPKTPLLGSAYRQDVYPQSCEISGAISQVLHYRETLLRELHTLTQGRHALLTGAEPRCVVIAGNAARDLTDDYRKGSFERFRERLFGVTVVTYDEIFGRVADLIALLEKSEERRG
ncbi:MAG: DUF4263 domain-containing protein [Betaproteobacteria bacterium]|nr:DUF4263 domain-containing protein [Betaproteobacteria bacterium]